MKVIKGLFYLLIGTLVFLFVTSFFLPANVQIERTTEIKAPIGKVFRRVNYLKSWEEWSPWKKVDPNLKIDYVGPLEGEGASYTWQSKDPRVGEGKVTILKSQPNDSVAVSIDFDGEGELLTTWRFIERSDSTILSWSADAHVTKGTPLLLKPYGKWAGRLMDGWIGPVFEQGLESIKEVSEKDIKSREPDPAPAPDPAEKAISRIGPIEHPVQT
ncbi:MAG: SRPBCC family protein [Verrucomicrobiota bacterium]